MFSISCLLFSRSFLSLCSSGCFISLCSRLIRFGFWFSLSLWSFLLFFRSIRLFFFLLLFIHTLTIFHLLLLHLLFISFLHVLHIWVALHVASFILLEIIRILELPFTSRFHSSWHFTYLFLIFLMRHPISIKTFLLQNSLLVK